MNDLRATPVLKPIRPQSASVKTKLMDGAPLHGIQTLSQAPEQTENEKAFTIL